MIKSNMANCFTILHNWYIRLQMMVLGWKYDDISDDDIYEKMYIK